ncbi:antibiotic biosynthesis monooxygenase [Corticibacterium sp. UT-5YL-CI-8]|nr:antibiotic biosynthesis monooxygenase [Tianweitania sp. UT-5YL-CI-8]
MTIIVDYDIVDGSEETFTSLIKEHAAATLREEPGCLRFDVVKPLDDGGAPVANKLMLVEVYADDAAVAAHKQNPRLPGVRDAAKPLLVSQRLMLTQSLNEKIAEEGIRPENLNAANDD